MLSSALNKATSPILLLRRCSARFLEIASEVHSSANSRSIESDNTSWCAFLPRGLCSRSTIDPERMLLPHPEGPVMARTLSLPREKSRRGLCNHSQVYSSRRPLAAVRSLITVRTVFVADAQPLPDDMDVHEIIVHFARPHCVDDMVFPRIEGVDVPAKQAVEVECDFV